MLKSGAMINNKSCVAFIVWVKAGSLFEGLNHALVLFLIPKLML